jgi:hypothetical protein
MELLMVAEEAAERLKVKTVTLVAWLSVAALVGLLVEEFSSEAGQKQAVWLSD